MTRVRQQTLVKRKYILKCLYLCICLFSVSVNLSWCNNNLNVSIKIVLYNSGLIQKIVQRIQLFGLDCKSDTYSAFIDTLCMK